MDEGKKELWKNKRMHGYFLRKLPEAGDEKEIWNWLRKADLKVEMEAMLYATKKQAIRATYVKCKIDKTAQLLLYRMCDKKSETISHILSKCERLAEKECNRRHNVARIVHRILCGKCNLKRSQKW